MANDNIILDVSDPPNDLSYVDFEDYYAIELLKVNNIEVSEQSLITELNNRETVLQGASAHALGNMGSTAAIQELKQLCTISEDLVKVEAAYALARIGVSEYRNTLKECLNYPVHAYLGPSIAAGDLARLGDSIGFPVLSKCFQINNLIIRAIACKQIILFLPFQNTLTGNGQKVDAYALFEQALHDSHPEVQRIALVQMRELRTPKIRNLLKNYLLTTADEYLKNIARNLLKQMT